jgi:multisubunit Na+/H+ antiporter MnhC subunit
MEILYALSGVILTPIIVGLHSKLAFGKILWKWLIGLSIVAAAFRVNIYLDAGKRINPNLVYRFSEAATPLIAALIIYMIVVNRKKKKLREENHDNNENI